MTDLDRLVMEELVPFRERIIENLRDKYPHVLSMADTILAGKRNKVGMQVMENGRVVGEYTFHLDGVHITSTDPGKLESEIHHPLLGILKPYAVVERTTLTKVVEDEASFTADFFTAAAKYLPEITIKFMR